MEVEVPGAGVGGEGEDDLVVVVAMVYEGGVGGVGGLGGCEGEEEERRGQKECTDKERHGATARKEEKTPYSEREDG